MNEEIFIGIGTSLYQQTVFNDVENWLNNNIGKNGVNWYWSMESKDDTMCYGVLLNSREDATAFKLRFGNEVSG